MLGLENLFYFLGEFVCCRGLRSRPGLFLQTCGRLRSLSLHPLRVRHTLENKARLWPSRLPLVNIALARMVEILIAAGNETFQTLGQIRFVCVGGHFTSGKVSTVNNAGGHDPELFDYFLPERWRHTPGKKLSATSETH